MNWTPVITIIFSLVATGIVSWLIFVTITVTEVDRSQEAVQEVNRSQDRSIIQLREEIHIMPMQVKDRWTGAQAQRERENMQREIDHLHDDLDEHTHMHSEIKHGE